MKVHGIVNKCKKEIKSRFSQKVNGDFLIHSIDVFHKYTDQLIKMRVKEYPPVIFACGKGCDVCCHNMRVEALLPEVFKIAMHISSLNPVERQGYIDRLEQHVKYAKGRTYRDYNTRCPFLGDDGGCSIYEVRPHKCRAHLSTDKEACNIPGNAKIDRMLNQAEDQLAIQVIDLYKKRGVSMNPTELGQAVLTALQDETCKTRWLEGEEVFDPLPEGITL